MLARVVLRSLFESWKTGRRRSGVDYASESVYSELEVSNTALLNENVLLRQALDSTKPRLSQHFFSLRRKLQQPTSLRRIHCT
jgi:hypothetical protein